MQFINERLIEEAAELLNASEESHEQMVEEIQREQPVLLSYFFTENFQAFTQSEKSIYSI